MKKNLIVVDMQNDFINGSLGTPEAVSIVPKVADKIRTFDGEIIVTKDTHFGDYLDSAEGKKLPVEHCIRGTEGWNLHPEIEEALSEKDYHTLEKLTFGSVDLPDMLFELTPDEEISIELVGLCTDICVVSNALILKAFFPDVNISVDSSCCAGVTPESHESALDTMKSCQIDIL